ncbi:hypothetical protein [Rothia sp. P100]|uniref:hypothetical protein n=1 Tax=unclassified Rothia (in: high G+C Gram-positive bacteria) TaxID=2689056 RepID=UPI002040D45B|nr:hypothetical protein [Rothia sp. P100]MCM3511078.1 hypothetical protein [Rothia sp. P100]
MANTPSRRPAQPHVSSATPAKNRTTKDQVADRTQAEAQQLKHQAVSSGERVLDTAKNKAEDVKEEVAYQAQDLIGQVRADLQKYVGPQQQRLAATIRNISDEINALSQGQQPQTSYVTGLLGNASGYVDTVATSIEQKDSQELINDVRRFAARKPGLFLAAALGVGLLAGRATRNVKDNDQIATDRESLKQYAGLESQQSEQPRSSAGLPAAEPERTFITQEDTSDVTAHHIPGAGYTAEGGNVR